MPSPQAASTPPPRSEYLYVIVNGDLSPGQQLAQTAHAVAMLAPPPSYVVVLQASLQELVEHSRAPGAVLVQEPDLDNIPTAVAMVGGGYWPHLSHLPLAGRVMAT